MSAEAEGSDRAVPAEELAHESQEPVRADLSHALRSRSERMSLRTLERRGFRNVQVLDMTTIENIVAESMTRMLERHTAVLSIDDRKRLEREAKGEFARLLLEHKAGAEKTDTERSREAFERQVQGLNAELLRQKVALDIELKKNDPSRLTMSPESFKLMEDKIRALFSQLISKEKRITLAEAGPSAVAGLTELEREVVAFLDRLMEGERERFIGSMRGSQSETVEILEKRILKLNKALAGTEDQLHRMAQLKSGDPGVASIYDSIQGLSPLATHFEKKKEILGIIFAENLAIQKNRPRRRSDTPVAAAAAARSNSRPLKVPSGFEAPLEPLLQESAI